MAFDVGQRLTVERRAQLYASAVNSNVWSYVEPKNLTPTWVHFDKRRGKPACPTGGFPIVRSGSRGSYVLIAQDCLNTLGYTTGGFGWCIWSTNIKRSKKLPKTSWIISRRNSRM